MRNKNDQYSYNSQYAQGYVCDQTDNGNLQQGSKIIIITVSKGEELIFVPYVIGFSESEARQVLENFGIDFYVQYSYNSQYTQGLVCAQTDNGSYLMRGSIITITVSKGEETAKTPNYTDDSLEAPSVPPQTQEAPGEIEITGYKFANDYVDVPNVVGKNESEAEQELVKEGFTVRIVRIEDESSISAYTFVASYIITYYVSAQSPEPYAKVKFGTEVTLTTKKNRPIAGWA